MIDLSLDGAVATLTLARPKARNAIPINGWGELAARAVDAQAAGARALVVAGSDQAFSAGADLGDFPALHTDESARRRFREAMREGMDSLAALAVPSIALVEGPCYGAGVALAMACDIRIASPGAVFAITPAKFGIAYPQEDVARLVALVGPGQAARLLLSARPVAAEEAARIGLVDVVGVQAREDALALARAIAEGSAGSHAVLKRGIALAARGVSSDAEQEAAFDALFGADDFRARFDAVRSRP